MTTNPSHAYTLGIEGYECPRDCNKEFREEFKNGALARVNGRSLATDTVCFCPECHEETLDVTITGGGELNDNERTVHWFEGNGVCRNCGHAGYYSDSD